jgi:hypothetical protein
MMNSIQLQPIFLIRYFYFQYKKQRKQVENFIIKLYFVSIVTVTGCTVKSFDAKIFRIRLVFAVKTTER